MPWPVNLSTSIELATASVAAAAVEGAGALPPMNKGSSTPSIQDAPEEKPPWATMALVTGGTGIDSPDAAVVKTMSEEPKAHVGIGDGEAGKRIWWMGTGGFGRGAVVKEVDALAASMP